MQTQKITIETDQYYVEALVHYTVDQEGDGIDSPVVTEVEIEEIDVYRVMVYDESVNDFILCEPNEEIKLLIETEFRK